MQIITDLEIYRKKPAKRLILAIGNFDGFHRGHQKLLRYTVAQAKKHRAIPAVLTFREHPQSVLHPRRRPMRLYSVEQRLFYLAQAGIRLCFLQHFTPSFSRMTPGEFVEKVLVRKLKVLEVVMGYDARFGRGREGTTGTMRELAKEHGFLFRKMTPVLFGRKPVSSSLIRKLLVQGEIEKANMCLGRPFSLWGKVVKGKGHGRHLGFPTANLEVHANVLLPLGVYVASARMLFPGLRGTPQVLANLAGHGLRIFDKRLRRPCPGDRIPGKWLPGVMNYGKRPTYPAVETPRPVLEMYLFHFHRNVYGGAMEVALHKFLRPEKRFFDEDALKAQIRRDVDAAREYRSKM